MFGNQHNQNAKQQGKCPVACAVVPAAKGKNSISKGMDIARDPAGVLDF